MSLGGSGSTGTCTDGGLREAICKSVASGVTYAVAAGNNAANVSGYVPAAFPEVITVSALADFNGLPGGGASPTCRSDVDDTIADTRAPASASAPSTASASAADHDHVVRPGLQEVRSPTG